MYINLTVVVLVVVLDIRNVYGGRRIPAYVVIDNNAESIITPGKDATLQVKGKGLTRGLEFSLTKVSSTRGSSCEHLLTPGISPDPKGLTHAHGRVVFPGAVTEALAGHDVAWLCIRDVRQVKHRDDSSIFTSSKWVHQGPDSKVVITTPLQWLNQIQLR